MPEDNKAMIERIYEVFANRDYEAVMSHFAEDFVWYAADIHRSRTKALTAASKP